MHVCSIDNIKMLLQKDLYTYKWPLNSRVQVIQKKLDTIKLDKKNGYEVAFFIAQLMNKHYLNRVGHVYLIEHILHIPELAYITNQDILVDRIEKKLAHSVRLRKVLSTIEDK